MKQHDVSRIYLTGMPGSGKSTEGKKLAKALQWTFLDLDTYIETLSGKSINQLFEQHGEAYFRELEHEALLQCSAKTKHIIACGGGTPAFFNNMEIMLESGLCVYLKASAAFLASRIQQGKRQRPLFFKMNLTQIEKKLEEIQELRTPYYEQAPIQVSIPLNDSKPLIKLIFPDF